jgi:hypothetical protein
MSEMSVTPFSVRHSVMHTNGRERKLDDYTEWGSSWYQDVNSQGS